MLALVWIFVNHLAEARFGSPFIANPSASWPPLAARIDQLQPISGFRYWDITLNFWRYIGWFGDQGVQLFIIMSGFGLTLGLLARESQKSRLPVLDFYARRAKRIIPLWWAVHIFFIVSFLIAGFGLSPFSLSTVLSFLGFRATPDLIYYFSPAWWYIPLILQLYLVYPILWKGLHRLGPWRFLIVSCGLALLIRSAGLMYFEEYLDAWSRGAIFITRLPEFAFGMSFAVWLKNEPATFHNHFTGLRFWLCLISAYSIGNILSLDLLGMTFAPFVTGVAAFLGLYALLGGIPDESESRLVSPLIWLGQHSYSLFLVHHPVINALIPKGESAWSKTLLLYASSVVVTLVLGFLIEEALETGSKMMKSISTAFGKARLVAGLVSVILLGCCLFIGLELTVRFFDPQEALGWGERPSLQPDSDIGWTLIPSKTTHLEWESYDYTLSANSLGFPGPEPSKTTDPETFRIIVTGDAFSSAEGVDTDQSWPRLLEINLSNEDPGRKVKVMNFAVTGYGPNQYVAVLDKYAPVYRPNLIIVETFVNDFQDVLISNDEFKKSIGFDQPAPDGLSSILRLGHLRRWRELRVMDPVKTLLKNGHQTHGYFLGNFQALERRNAAYEYRATEKLTSRIERIKEIADSQGAKLVIVMAPASVQVCGPSKLNYFPKNVDLSDTEVFDIDLPQRTMNQITKSFDIPFVDLRDALTGDSQDCPYQANNMHWTKTGHQMVADYIADTLLTKGYIR